MKFNLTAHREMWLWLAKHPDKNKWDWPGWKYNGGTYEMDVAFRDCFACEYAGKKPDKPYEQECCRCPLIWVRGNGMPMVPQPYMCENGGCYEAFKNSGAIKLRPRFATMVANLKVREGVETI